MSAVEDNRVPLIVAAAFFMETLDGSIIVTALPAIAHSFGVAALSLGLAISAYLVAVAVFVPAAGWLSDRYGQRRVFASAVGCFTFASALCGVSTGFWTFVGARVLQGASAAFMSPVGRLVVLRETPKHRLIESLGLIVWPALIGPVIGPPLGGFIATWFSWRWIFFVNLPIGVVGLWLVLRHIPEHRSGERKPFDGLGFALTGAALVALIQGLALVSRGHALAWPGATLAAFGLVCAVFAVRHAKRHPAPLLDLQAARDPTFVLSTLTAGLLSRVAIQATPFLLPLMFQIGFGESALQAGLMVLVYMAGNLSMKVATTQVLRRYGFRSVVVGNGALAALAVAGCAFIAPGWPSLAVGAVLMAAGMTRSMQFTATNTMAFADIPAAARSGATTMAAVFQQIGAALGVAVATLALAFSQRAGGESQPTRADFRFALLVCAVLLVVSALWSRRLPRDAGAEAIARASAPSS